MGLALRSDFMERIGLLADPLHLTVRSMAMPSPVPGFGPRKGLHWFGEVVAGQGCPFLQLLDGQRMFPRPSPTDSVGTLR